MRISSKGRYALAAVMTMARQYDNGEYITVLSISEKLGISKIYLEQVFSLLKQAGLVISVKGAQGGYQLKRSPEKITALDVLSSVEFALFEKTRETVHDKAPEIERAMQKLAFGTMDEAVKKSLGTVTILDLVNEAEKCDDGMMMFYI